MTELELRPAREADLRAMADIYNAGIRGRTATLRQQSAKSQG